MGRAEYMRNYRNKRNTVTEDVTPTVTSSHKAVTQPVTLPDASLFNGKGRGIPVSGHVLIGHADGDYVVTERAWHARLHSGCSHLPAWQCKSCH